MGTPQQLGPYRIVRPLGQGGMGAVYEAIQEPIGRRVAVKVLLAQHAQDRDAVARFFNEARAVNLIEHPSIVQVSDYGQATDGTVYLAMEYLRGQTLSERLATIAADGKRAPVTEVVRWATQLSEALAAAHDKSVIHRDLKPSNVMLVQDSAVAGGMRAKLLDFGIAKLAQGDSRGTASGAVFGTPQYMSPEQCAGAGSVDAQTDVYALGVMLFEALAGRLPFVAGTALEYMGQHAFKEPPALSTLAPQAPADLQALVHRMLHKDRSVRPTMRAVRGALVSLQAQLPEPMVTAGSEPAPAAFASRPGLVVATPPSTLGNSLGQPLQSRRTSQHWLPVAGAILGGGMVVLGLQVWRTQSQQGSPLPSRETPAAGDSAKGQDVTAAPATRTPAEVPARPVPSPSTPVSPRTNEPAAAQPTPSKPRPAAASKPATNPRPHSKPAAETKSPPVQSPPPEVPSTLRPVRRED
ncbi:MAG TPA: protein kinase [Pseudomonadota bacterium]|nr:protein kinase [Pseudomonadota bacterium]